MKIMNFLRNKVGVIIAIGLIGYLVVTASLTSCQKEDLTQEQQTDAFIEECRTFYDGLVKDDEPLSTSHNEQAKGNLSFPKRTPRWEQALAHSITIGQSVAVPLNYEGNPFVRTSVNPNDLSMESISYLLIYKDKKKAMHAEVVYLLRDESPSASSETASSGFTGAIYVEDLKGNYLKGYLCLPEGRVLRFGTPSTKEVPSNAGPQNSPVKVECVTVSFYRRYSLDGGVTWSAPVLQSTRIECSLSVFYNGDDGGSGGGPDDYLSGGGDSTQPEPYSTPCMKSQLISSTPSLTSHLNELKSSATSLDYEVGYTVNSKSQYAYYTGPFDACYVPFSVNTYLRLVIHTHNIGCGEMHSLGDVKLIYDLMRKGVIVPTGFQMGLVNYRGNVYYLSISNLDKFNAFTTGWDQASTFNAQSANFDSAYQSVYGKLASEQEAWFLDYMKNSGLTLLKDTGATGLKQVSTGADGKVTTVPPCN